MTDKMDQTLEEMAAEILKEAPAERHLRSFSTKEWLQGVPAEELLKAMGPEEKKRLRKLLDEEIAGG